jgi:hypothetical protein
LSNIWQLLLLQYVTANQDLGELYKTSIRVAATKRVSLEWLGNKIRLKETRVDKKFFSSKPEGRKKVGKTR